MNGMEFTRHMVLEDVDTSCRKINTLACQIKLSDQTKATYIAVKYIQYSIGRYINDTQPR